MSQGLTEQIEHLHGQRTKSRRYVKKAKLRSERRRANRDPETPPTYRRYSGWEY